MRTEFAVVGVAAAAVRERRIEMEDASHGDLFDLSGENNPKFLLYY